MKLSDFKGLFSTHKLEFISAVNTFDDYYEITLSKPENLKWRAGEHGIFTLPNKKVEGKKYRAFSIASTPKEGVILLGTRTGKTPSSFKRELLNLSKGDLVKLRGPFGWFTLQDKESPVVLIALGVGITPIRALLTSLEHQHHREVDLVYSSNDLFLYKERIEEIINHNKSFNIVYPKTIEDTNISILQNSKKYQNNAYYYISGNPNAIKAIKKLLKDNGVKKSRIINDPFL